MREILNQEEIDALFSAAQQGPKGASAAAKKNVVPCDLRRSGLPASDQLGVLTALHESLARRLGISLAVYLRVPFEINLVSAEQLTFEEFLSRAPELSYFCSLHVMPIDARAAVQVEPSLVFPVVDLVLGGSGADPIKPREFTEIEEQIFETIIRLVARDLQSTWAAVIELDVRFDQRQQYAQVQNLMHPHEKILYLSLEIRLLDARGTLNMAFPAVVTNALFRKLSSQGSFLERIPSANSRKRLRERLLDSSFLADLSLPPSPMKIRELLALAPGHVLPLPVPRAGPICFNIAGKPMFLAYPVDHGAKKGARIDRRSTIVPANGREAK
jgi:flagellar motor switch protein FliM